MKQYIKYIVLLTIALSAVLWATSCVSLKPLPDTRREVFVFDINQDTLFDATNEWLTRNAGEMPVDIALHDRRAGRITAVVDAPFALGATDVAQRIRLNVDVLVKAPRARLIVRPAGVVSSDGGTQKAATPGIKGKSRKRQEKLIQAIDKSLDAFFADYKNFITDTYVPF